MKGNGIDTKKINELAQYGRTDFLKFMGTLTLSNRERG